MEIRPCSDEQVSDPPRPGGDPEQASDGSRSDAELVEAALSGDPDAFGLVYLRWFDPVYDVARRIVRDPETAAEVAQDVFLHGWRALAELRDPAAVGGWLLRSSRNRALNRFEREKRSVAVDPQESPEEDLPRSPAPWNRLAVATDPTDAMADEEVAELVWQSADALGERDVSLLDLHLRHHLSPAEIAEELDVAPNAAHQMLFRLRNRLGRAVRARVLWRDGHPRCEELAAALKEADLRAFGPAAVTLISSHVESCEDCRGHQRTRLAPAVLFGSAAASAAPISLIADVAAALEAEGVPLGSVVADLRRRAAGAQVRRWPSKVAAVAVVAMVALLGLAVGDGGDGGEERAFGADLDSTGEASLLADRGGVGGGLFAWGATASGVEDAVAAADPAGVGSDATTTTTSSESDTATGGAGAPNPSGGSGESASGSPTTSTTAAPSPSGGGSGGGVDGSGGPSGPAPPAPPAPPVPPAPPGGAGGGGVTTTGAPPPDPPYIKYVDVSVKSCTKGGTAVVNVTYSAPAGDAGWSGSWSLSDGSGGGSFALSAGVGEFSFVTDPTGAKVYVDVAVADPLGGSASGSGVAYC